MKTALLITGLSMLLSAGCIVVIGILNNFDETVWPTAFATSLGIPLLVAPLVTYFVVQLLFELEVNRAKLTELAARNTLTQLFNRRHFIEQMELTVARFNRTGEPLALLFVDADHFKAVNDTHGHATGDLVLQRIAHVLQLALRSGDLAARYGGEEFVVLLPGATHEVAVSVAERILSAVRSVSIPTPTAGSIRPTVSIGICVHSKGHTTTNALLKRGDAAMYRAKSNGRNCWASA
jgi:diguanylate cyclase (GGDEF)-like protein